MPLDDLPQIAAASRRRLVDEVSRSIEEAILAGAMLRVVQDTTLRERLSAAGRRRAAGFTWEKSAEGHADVYHAAACRT